MRFRVVNFPDPIVLYGEKECVEGLCDDLMALGVLPERLTTSEGDRAYRGVPVGAFHEIRDLDPASGVRLIPSIKPGESFGLKSKEILAINPHLRDCVQRDLEFMGELMTYAEPLDLPEVKTPSRDHTWMGLNLGFVLGGVETWVAETYHELKRAGAKVEILEPIQPSSYDYVGPEFYGIDPDEVIQVGPYEDFASYSARVFELLCEDAPRIFIDNGSFRVMAGAYLAKKWLKLPIKVVQVIHGDYDIFYNRFKFFRDQVDLVVAVSEDIRRHVVQMAPEWARDVKVKLRLPELHPESLKQKRADGALHIAYAARLEEGNKRSLWLKDVARGLRARGIPFVLHVAGDGQCAQQLRDFVEAEGFSEQMPLYGRVEHSRMNAFYADKHAFVNFSRSEGGPLTLFESMSHGAVPVVTDAGSARKLIREGESGHIIDSPSQVVDRLCALAQETQRLHAMQRAALAALTEYRDAQGDFISDFL